MAASVLDVPQPDTVEEREIRTDDEIRIEPGGVTQTETSRGSRINHTRRPRGPVKSNSTTVRRSGSSSRLIRW